MNEYNVYKNPSGVVEAVKQGWSWPAFLFTAIWALTKGLYALGAGIFILFLFLHLFLNSIVEGAGSGNPITLFITLGVAVWLGMEANKLREKDLKKKGYDFISSIEATTPEGAISYVMKSGIPDIMESEYECGECGADTFSDAKYCVNCGVSFTCEKCDTQKVPDAHYCYKCGTKF